MEETWIFQSKGTPVQYSVKKYCLINNSLPVVNNGLSNKKRNQKKKFQKSNNLFDIHNEYDNLLFKKVDLIMKGKKTYL